MTPQRGEHSSSSARALLPMHGMFWYAGPKQHVKTAYKQTKETQAAARPTFFFFLSAISATESTAEGAKTTSPSTPPIVPWIRRLVFLLLVPLALAVLLYRDDGFDPSPLPDSGPWPSRAVPVHHARILSAVEKVADGLLVGPEDFAYDADARLLYTGCADGWIKRLSLSHAEASSVTVADWAYVGGRPLGVAFGPDKELIVAEADKGLLRVSREGGVELLTDEAEGLKFRFTDAVDVASDGVMYFTDASHKYSLAQAWLDLLEGRPYGRLLSYNPSTKSTQVLVRGLFFANGVALSPHHDYLVFCETVLRCQKYHIQGEKKGRVEDFIDNLPGYPDNIRYDGEGHFWIGIAMARAREWDIIMKYPFVRKAMVTIERYVKLPNLQHDAGVLSVNLKGEPVALYSDPSLAGVTGGLKIGDQLYYGLLFGSYIGRINLTQHPPHAL